MRQTHTGLYVARLDLERHLRTCGYWYTVTAGGGTPHTAFRTRAGLDRWLTERGLTLAGSLDAEPSSCAINGTYRTESHLHDADRFGELAGLVSRTLSNGDYVAAVITTDPDGVRTVHTLNPNVRTRAVYDYRESRRMQDEAEPGRYWFRQLGAGTWVAYDGRQLIWEDHERAGLVAWLRARGIEAEHRPLTITRVV